MKRIRGVAPLASLVLIGLGAALWGRLGAVSDQELAARETHFTSRAAAVLEADAATLARIAARLQKSRDFTEIVEGGGTEVRPARLFSLLSRALPEGPGWGAIFFDAAGRAVAWGGDAGDLDSGQESSGSGLTASFHVTRFRVAFRSPCGEGRDRRGVLALSRRYPTGILGQDLIESLSLAGGPTRLRMRAMAF
ncbi:MAG: hypothetical protein ABIT01_05525, partial [Thermoanaerobaculia bacterium]